MLEVNCREIFSSLQSETIYEKKKKQHFIYMENILMKIEKF